MRNRLLIAALLVVATSCFAGVNIVSPSNGSTVSSPVHFVASASGSGPIASMIIYVDGNQAYLVYASSLDTSIELGQGSHSVVIKAWDNYGNVYSQSETITVGAGASSGGAGVTISSPANGATVGSPVHFVASAQGNAPIASMILYVDGNQQYLTYSANLDTTVALGDGIHYVQVNSWDNNGGIYVAKEAITVGGSGGGGGTTTTSSGIGVNVSSPADGASAGSPVHFAATANGNAAISAMALYVDGNDTALVYSNSISQDVSLGGGSHNAVFRAWDNNGQVYSKTVNFSVGGGGGGSSSGGSSGSSVTAGTTIYDIQTQGGWGDCSVCAGAGGNGPAAGYSMEQWQGSPSLDGKSTKFSIWGSTPYSDVLWWKSLTSQVQNLDAHHFIYDTYFYVNNSDAVQSLEFDINQFINGHSLIFGTQCNVRDGNSWDVWDNQNSRWVSTGVWCGAPAAYTWHHVTIEVERASDGGDWLHYVAITLDGEKHYIDRWYPPAGTGWNGVTVNFQMDGNYQMAAYSVWLDKLTFSYW